MPLINSSLYPQVHYLHLGQRSTAFPGVQLPWDRALLQGTAWQDTSPSHWDGEERLQGEQGACDLTAVLQLERGPQIEACHHWEIHITTVFPSCEQGGPPDEVHPLRQCLDDCYHLWGVVPQDFAPLVRYQLRRAGLQEKAVLLLDNCSAHPPGSTLQGGKIRAYFLPPNTTSKIQPLDLGVIASFKCHYGRHLMQKAILETDIADLMKKVNVKDAVYLGHRAWDDVTPQTIRNCWDKALSFGTTSQPAEEDNDFEAFSMEDIELAEGMFLQGLRVSSSIAS